MLATAAACGFVLGTRGMHDALVAQSMSPHCSRAAVNVHAGEQPTVSIAVCTGSSCESRCNFNSVVAFEALAAGESTAVSVSEINCMNMCKRGPAVRIVADDLVATVDERMSELEHKRTAFQNVATMARVEAVYGVARSIADGSNRDAYGGFCVTLHGPLPPSAM
uniref:Uncharacterized protein n=1 Tax=Calcidiscus leptoporus TaxID=127549 RepID=A0A7S0JLN6_9EUKA|mmetsp:Transcript_9130/g.21226  ORF Transcript_9130/g.21226 Transcript_9130/m.21226 type:complete len:165 (+) Transcript_9130:112-606(+)